MIELLNVDITEAYNISFDPNEEFTASVDEDNACWLYKKSYTVEERPLVQSFNLEQQDGLTPIDPTKPRFPKK